MPDNDNVTYLKMQPKNPDNEAFSYFLEGASQHAAYQDAEAMAAACMNGILTVINKKIGGIKDDNVHGDAAVIAVLIQGMFMRQVGVPCPEINLLDDIRDILTNKVESE
jgi:hypothetical protein